MVFNVLSIFFVPLTQGSVPNKLCNFEKISFENAVNVWRVGFVAYKLKKKQISLWTAMIVSISCAWYATSLVERWSLIEYPEVPTGP